MKKYSYWVSAIAVFSLLFACLPSYYKSSEALQKLTLETRDLFFKIRRFSTAPPQGIEDIVIVRIDEESSEKLEARWPWSRRIFAAMVDELAKRGAKVVGLNLSFTGLEEGGEASTAEMARAARDHGNVVIGNTFTSDNRLMKPSPLLAENVSRYGYLEKIVDPDYSIRRSYLLRPYSLKRLGSETQRSGAEGHFKSSFPLQIAAARAGRSQASDVQFDAELGQVRVGSPLRAMYVEPDGSYTINYLAKEEDFASIPAWKVVQGKVPAEEVRGKVVLVGLTSTLFGDTHPTPYGMMPGIVIHANEYLSIQTGRFLRFVPDGVEFLLSYLNGFCVLIFFLFRRFWLSLFGFVLVFFGLFFGAQMAFAQDYLIEPFILLLGPVLAAGFGVLANSLKLLMENRGLETKVIHDKLTGLYKYEYLRDCLDEEWKRCIRSKVPVSIAMTDLDRFKKINDTLGHEVGNDMIRKAGEVIKESARRYDVVSRYGGDEFVILLWHTGGEEAKAYRQRLRGAYEVMAKRLRAELQDASISIGVATFDPNTDTDHPSSPQELIEQADKDLFDDKESRRKGPSR